MRLVRDYQCLESPNLSMGNLIVDSFRGLTSAITFIIVFHKINGFKYYDSNQPVNRFRQKVRARNMQSTGLEIRLRFYRFRLLSLYHFYHFTFLSEIRILTAMRKNPFNYDETVWSFGGGQ